MSRDIKVEDLQSRSSRIGCGEVRKENGFTFEAMKPDYIKR